MLVLGGTWEGKRAGQCVRCVICVAVVCAGRVPSWGLRVACLHRLWGCVYVCVGDHNVGFGPGCEEGWAGCANSSERQLRSRCKPIQIYGHNCLHTHEPFKQTAQTRINVLAPRRTSSRSSRRHSRPSTGTRPTPSAWAPPPSTPPAPSGTSRCGADGGVRRVACGVGWRLVVVAAFRPPLLNVSPPWSDLQSLTAAVCVLCALRLHRPPPSPSKPCQYPPP